MGADGSMTLINNVVSQSVPHLHLHVILRRRGDGLRTGSDPGAATTTTTTRRGRLADIRKAIA